MLGPIRILFLVPRVVTRIGELETPVIFVVIIISARFVVRRLVVTRAAQFGMSIVAATLLVSAEFTLVLWLRGVSIAEYLANRDPVARTVYYVMIVVFAVTPLLIRRQPGRLVGDCNSRALFRDRRRPASMTT